MSLDPRPAAGRGASTADRQAMLAMMAFAALWAVIEGIVGIRLRQPYDITQIVWCRYATHLSIVFLLWGWRAPAVWSTSRPVFHIGRSVLMLIMPVGFALALRVGLPDPTLWTIVWAAPVMVLVLARFVLGERPADAARAAAIGGFFAVVLVMSPWERAMVMPPLGMLGAALMMGSFALYVVATRALRTEALRTNLFYTAIAPFVVLSAYVPRVWLRPGLDDVVIMVGIGAVGFVTLVALHAALERAEASVTASFVHMQAVVSLLIVWRRQPYAPSLHVLTGVLTIVGLAAWQWVLCGPSSELTEDRRQEGEPARTA